jgi:excisionase family DNA binding protein
MTTTAAPQKPWNTEETADFLGIHARTVTRLAKSGELPGFRIGTHWRFLPSDLDAWMRARVSSSQLNSVRDN